MLMDGPLSKSTGSSFCRNVYRTEKIQTASYCKEKKCPLYDGISSLYLTYHILMGNLRVDALLEFNVAFAIQRKFNYGHRRVSFGKWNCMILTL